MRSRSIVQSLRRRGLRGAALVGFVSSFLGSTSAVQAAPLPNSSQERPDPDEDCPEEDAECSYKKPNFLIVMDYSSSMIEDLSGTPRWDAAEDAVQRMITMQGGYFDDNMHFAVMRYAHEQDSNPTGCPVDGSVVDVDWYDRGNDPEYFECNGEAVIEFADDTSQPPEGQCGTWTKNAMEAAQDRA